MNATSQIEAIIGCMFSGKTSALFDRIARAESLNCRWRLFKHCIDDRYGTDTVTTHNGKRREARMVSSAAAILRNAVDVDLVAIDEGHFFDPALPTACRHLADAGVSVVVTALDRDSWGCPFELVAGICDVANEVTILRAACARCDAPATRTQRLTPIIDGNLVGGPEAYEPRCETCFRRPVEAPPTTQLAPAVTPGAPLPSRPAIRSAALPAPSPRGSSIA